jgi:hypothetical protein
MEIEIRIIPENETEIELLKKLDATLQNASFHRKHETKSI